MTLESMELEVVVPTEIQIADLYWQLSNRNKNISHSYLPKYEDHEIFVANHPYRAWFIIKKKNVSMGNVYIQYDNSIGLNCVDELGELQIKNILNLVTTDFQPLDAVPSVRVNKFFLNVAASNIQLQEKLKNLGLVESQRSFIYEK